MINQWLLEFIIYLVFLYGLVYLFVFDYGSFFHYEVDDNMIKDKKLCPMKKRNENYHYSRRFINVAKDIPDSFL